MRKGITPVIALILLLVITIVIVGFSFTIFQGIVSSGGSAVENAQEETTSRLGQVATIESVSGNTIYIRNRGSGAIDPSTLALYAGSTLVPVTGGANIPPGEIGGVTVDFGSLSGTYTIKVTTAGGSISTLPNVAVQGGSPLVTLSSPPQGWPYPTGTTQTTLDCGATDPDGVNTLEVHANIQGQSLQLKCADGDLCDTNAADDQISYIYTGLADGTTYHWNCRAVDTLSQIGWGNERTFSVQAPGPSAPIVTLQSPDDLHLFAVGTAQANLSCSASDSDGTVDVLEVHANVQGQPLQLKCADGDVCDTNPVDDQVTYTYSGLVDGGAYVWNCRAVDNDLQEAWGTQRSFSVTPATPPTVTLSIPADQLGRVEIVVQMTFACSTTAGSYPIAQLEFWNTIGGSWQKAQNVTGTSIINYTYNIAAGNHLWNCRAIDTHGNVAWAPANRTLIVNQSVYLKQPGNGTQFLPNTTISFACNATVDSSTDLLAIDLYTNITGGAMTVINTSHTPSGTKFNQLAYNYTVPGGTPPGLYGWNCKAVDGNPQSPHNFAPANRTVQILAP